jgi:hypothetical protein
VADLTIRKGTNMTKKMVILAVAVTVAVLVFGTPLVSFAGNPIGKFCFTDNFGATWVLNAGAFGGGSQSFEDHGYRIVGFTCNGSNTQPTTGSSTNRDSKITLGAWTAANQPGACIGVSWHAVGTSTNSLSGGWRNQADTEGTFTLTKINCPSPSALSGEGEVPAFNADDPTLAK